MRFYDAETLRHLANLELHPGGTGEGTAGGPRVWPVASTVRSSSFGPPSISWSCRVMLSARVSNPPCTDGGGAESYPELVRAGAMLAALG